MVFLVIWENNTRRTPARRVEIMRFKRRFLLKLRKFRKFLKVLKVINTLVLKEVMRFRRFIHS